MASYRLKRTADRAETAAQSAAMPALGSQADISERPALRRLRAQQRTFVEFSPKERALVVGQWEGGDDLGFSPTVLDASTLACTAIGK